MRPRTTFWCSYDKGWYFRVLGYGLSYSTDSYVPFSVRMGYRKELSLFGGPLEDTHSRRLGPVTCPSDQLGALQ